MKNQISGYCYDLAGNLLGTSPCPGLPYSPTYSYDGENRLKGVGGVTYTYDGDGSRVKKSSGTLYWGAGPLAESDLTASSASWKDYIFFNGARVAKRDSTTTHYFFSDELGSTSVVRNDTTGALEEDIVYLPYGAIFSGTSADHYLFNGKERDTESGWDEFGARYYASSWGRFTIPDWAEKPTDVPYANFGNPQSLNLYSYVKNNPTTFGDPDGHDPIELTAGVVGITVAAIITTAIMATDTHFRDALIQTVQRATHQSTMTTDLPTGIPGTTATDVPTAPPGKTATDVPKGTPGTTATDVPTGTPASTSQQGSVNAAPVTSKGNQGSIYVVPGSGTQSGNEYVGRHNKPNPAKTRRSKDGRDRAQAQVVDSYDPSNVQDGRAKEQAQIDARGGISNLDNRRNEIRKTCKPNEGCK